MVFLVASDGETLDCRVSKRLGHARNHLIVESEPWTVELLAGDPEQLPRHGLDRLANRQLDGVITGNVGPQAWSDFVALDLVGYVARSLTVREAVEKVIAGEIPVMDGPTMKRSIRDHASHDHGHAGHGAGHAHGH